MKFEIGDKIVGRSWIFEYPEYGGNHYEYFHTTITGIKETNLGTYYLIEPKCFRCGLFAYDILLKINN